MQCSKKRYSITSSASASSLSGTVRPSVSTVLRFDHQLELGWQHNRQIGRFSTFKNPTGVDASLVIRVTETGSVAHEAALHRERPPRVQCGNGVTSCQSRNLIDVAWRGV